MKSTIVPLVIVILISVLLFGARVTESSSVRGAGESEGVGSAAAGPSCWSLSAIEAMGWVSLASSSSARDVLISPMRWSPVSLPRPVGSMPNSAGRTMVMRMTAAAMMAMIVSLRSFLVDGSSV